MSWTAAYNVYPYRGPVPKGWSTCMIDPIDMTADVLPADAVVPLTNLKWRAIYWYKGAGGIIREGTTDELQAWQSAKADKETR